jgi:predicted secreted protein
MEGRSVAQPLRQRLSGQAQPVRRRRRPTAALLATLCLALGAGSFWIAQSNATEGGFPQFPPIPVGDGGPDNGSPDGYPNASEPQAENLFTTNFSSTVDSLAQDPPDLSGENPRFVDDRNALIASNGQSPAALKDEVQQILEQDQGDPAAARTDLNDLLAQQNSGTPKLVSSTQALRAPDQGGQQAPVDLSLDSQAAGYVPANPLVDLTLPNNLNNDVTVGDQGLKVDVGATQSSTADPITGGENLFYAEAATDTDVVLAPISVGVETFYQLRSPQSPEHFEMSFTLPAGASLQAAGGGGAAIVKNGQTLAAIPAPSAHDAAGDPVPVTASVNGNSLDLSVPHQDAGLSYPISVDPVIDTYVGTNIANFTANWTAGQATGSYYQTGTTCTQNISCTSGTTGPRGLYINAPSNHSYASGEAASWVYKVPHYPTSTAYISDLLLSQLNHHLHSGTYVDPYLAAGIFAPSSFAWLKSKTQQTEASNLSWDLSPTNQTTAPSGKMAVYQLTAGSTHTLTNWRDAFLGSATMTLADTDDPTASVDTAPLTQGWIDTQVTTPFQVQVADGGLGVSEVLAPGADGLTTTTFHNQDTPSAGDCLGTNVSPCPQSGTVNASFIPGQLSQGQSENLAIVWDPLGKVGLEDWTMRGDGSPPLLTISGGLSEAATGNPYKLRVDAVDGTTDDPINWRSGVRRIYVQLNGVTLSDADTGTHACTPTAGSCSLSLDHTFDPSDFSSDNLHFAVVSSDELGHGRTVQWDVTLPNTSINSGPSGPTSSATPHFTYGSSVSGSSFQCRIDTASYSSCPASGYTAASLGDGSHTFYVKATNPAGQVDQTPASRAFTVDTQAPSASIGSGPSGPTKDPRPTFGFSSTDGSATFTCSIDTGTASYGSCSGAATHQPASNLADGSYSFRVKATDPAGNSTTATRSFSVDSHLDTAAPQLEESGKLVDTSHALVGAEPEVDVDATDAGSGVTSVKILIDGQQADELTQDCPDGGCELQDSLQPDLSDQDPGTHSYQLVATDGAGNTANDSGTFRLDPARPELAVVGDLADSDGLPLDANTANADIEATDSATGDSGVAMIEVFVDETADATDHVSCDPSCPTSADSAYTYHRSDWGAGPHTVRVVATDAAGNVQQSILDVDEPIPQAPAQCPEVSPTVQDSVHAVNTTQAQEEAIAPALAPSVSTYDLESDSDIDPSLSRPDDSPPTPLDATGSETDDDVASRAAGGFNVDQVTCVVPTQTTADETNATIASGDSALYANSATDTDTIIRPTAAGETAIESLRGAGSPASFSWKIGVQEGDELVELQNGGIAVVDPSEDAPSDLTVPDQPAGAQDATSLPDAATQVAENNYQVLNAEQETGKSVAAVISAPYMVDAQGSSDQTTLTLTGVDRITVDSDPTARAVVMPVTVNLAKRPAPNPVAAWYMNGENQDQLKAQARDDACAFAHRQQNDNGRVLLLNFGAAHKHDGSFGARLTLAGTYFDNAKILDALKRASDRYHDCSTNGAAIITYGNTNQMTNDTEDHARAAGVHQAATVNHLFYHEHVAHSYGNEGEAAGGDIEPGYAVVGPSKDLVNGANNGTTYYDFGNAGGCLTPEGCHHNWSLTDLADVSFAAASLPLPEIYESVNARQWAEVRQHWSHPHHYFYAGITSEPKSAGASLWPGEAWKKLRDQANGNVHRELVKIGYN